MYILYLQVAESLISELEVIVLHVYVAFVYPKDECLTLGVGEILHFRVRFCYS